MTGPGRFWTSRNIGIAGAAFWFAFLAEVIWLEVARPSVPAPEHGYVLPEGDRINHRQVTFYISGADLIFEMLLFAGAAASSVAGLVLWRRGN